MSVPALLQSRAARLRSLLDHADTDERRETIAHVLYLEDLTLKALREGPKSQKATHFPVNLLIGWMRSGVFLPSGPGQWENGKPSEQALEAQATQHDAEFNERLSGKELKEPVMTYGPFGTLDAETTLNLMDAHLTYHQKRAPFKLKT